MIGSFLRCLAWSLGLGFVIETSPGIFFPLNFMESSLDFSGKKGKKRRKPLGNSEITKRLESGFSFDLKYSA